MRIVTANGTTADGPVDDLDGAPVRLHRTDGASVSGVLQVACPQTLWLTPLGPEQQAPDQVGEPCGFAASAVTAVELVACRPANAA